MTLPTSSHNAVHKDALATELLSTICEFARELARFYEGQKATPVTRIEVIDPAPPTLPWYRRLLPPLEDLPTKHIMCWMVYDASLREGLEIYVDAASGEPYVSPRTIMPTLPKKLGFTELMDYSVDELLDLLASFKKGVPRVTNTLGAMH